MDVEGKCTDLFESITGNLHEEVKEKYNTRKLS
jgi:hypothetical protein